jgi:hypothetical protein
MSRAHRTALDLRPLRPVDPTLPDRTADLARGPAETEWTRRALGGWQDPDMLQRHPPTRMEIESETGVAFFRGALNALAFSLVLAALTGLYLIGG